MSDRKYSQFTFGEGEHPTSTKMNNILIVSEDNRWMIGRTNTLQATSGTVDYFTYYLRMNENIGEIGGCWTDTDVISRAKFTIEYDINSATPDEATYARWENVAFVSGDSDMNNEWYCTLTSSLLMTYGTLASGLLGDGVNLDLTTAIASSFKCVRQFVATGA